MGFPNEITRTVEIAHPPATVWAALTTADGLASWFGHTATIDLRPGGEAACTTRRTAETSGAGAARSAN